MDDDIRKVNLPDQEALMIEQLDSMDAETRVAILEVIHFLAYEKLADAEPMTDETMEECVDAIKLRNLRRKRGTYTAAILPFKKPS